MSSDSLISISVLGRPGAGKDTQSELLANFFNLRQIKTSSLIIKKFKDADNDPVIMRQKEAYYTGDLAEPKWVLSVIEEYIQDLFNKDIEGKNGIVFGGSPRTLYEAENLTPFLIKCFGEKNVIAIYLDIHSDEGLERIIKRNSRALDRDPKVIAIRMREFREHTIPAINYFEKRGKLLKIDGTGTKKEVFSLIQTKLKEADFYGKD